MSVTHAKILRMPESVLYIVFLSLYASPLTSPLEVNILRCMFHIYKFQNLCIISHTFQIFCSQPSEEHKFTAVPIQKQNLILITPQSHPLSAKDSVDLVETIPYPQIFFEKSAGIRNVIDQMFARTGASPKIAYETEEDQVIAGLVAQGFGIAVVPYMDILQKLNVNILQIRSPNYERAFFMVHNDCVFIPPVVQKFRQFVLDDGMMLTEEPA